MRFNTSPIRSKALRSGAKGQSCKLQLPGVCNFDDQTTVLAHLPSDPHGMALKGDDLVAVEACSACHDAIDGRGSYAWQAGERESAVYAALTRQLHSWVGRGLVSVTGEDGVAEQLTLIDESVAVFVHSYPITPVPKPRMTQRDKWQQRPAVMRYRAFCDAVRVAGITLPEAGYHVTFYLPMPASWSARKRLNMAGKPHQQRPDKDNLEKALLDAIYAEDCQIWDGRTTKRWGVEGRIEITVA
ncbi:MAG: nuclease domain-containing protein [Aeromonas sp.]